MIALTALGVKQAQFPSPTYQAPEAQICVAQNQRQQGNTVFIGRIPGAPYVVIIPAPQPNTLTVVRQCIPDAFQTDSRFGPYVQAGVFYGRRQAEAVVRYLRTLDLDARVIYRP